MKVDRPYPAITVSNSRYRICKQGHPWIYETDIIGEENIGENGSFTDVFSEKGQYLGTGFYSAESKIRVRIFSWNASDSYNPSFWERRISYALDYRKTVMDTLDSVRLIYGESDQLPGLTADKFNNIIVTQTLSAGIEKIKETVFNAMLSVLESDGIKVDGIYERNDVAIRELEGLTQYKGWYGTDPGISPVTLITENGLKFEVDVENGQKTGFFLDQKYNRLAVSKIAKGRNVLDCCTHTGSFALNAAKGGAKHVTAVDISPAAIKETEKNIVLNGFSDTVTAVESDMFDCLENTVKGRYDLIILDPPAFTKSRKTIPTALKGYKKLNSAAMSKLKRGGYLATCSCSHFVTPSMFEDMLRESAFSAGVSLKLVEQRKQSPDHPIMLSIPETEYLKFYILQIL